MNKLLTTVATVLVTLLAFSATVSAQDGGENQETPPPESQEVVETQTNEGDETDGGPTACESAIEALVEAEAQANKEAKNFYGSPYALVYDGLDLISNNKFDADGEPDDNPVDHRKEISDAEANVVTNCTPDEGSQYFQDVLADISEEWGDWTLYEIDGKIVMDRKARSALRTKDSCDKGDLRKVSGNTYAEGANECATEEERGPVTVPATRDAEGNLLTQEKRGNDVRGYVRRDVTAEVAKRPDFKLATKVREITTN